MTKTYILKWMKHIGGLLAALMALALSTGCPQEGKNPVILIKTSHGDIKVELFAEEAPVTVENFLTYVKDGFYDGTVFHRVIDGFMIQGGGFTEDLQQKSTRDAIANEAHNGLANTRGTLAMARTPEVDSATAQFFINVSDNGFLDHKGKRPDQYGYCVFGKVIEGMETVDAIKAVKTGNRGYMQDVPVEPVVIREAVVVP